LRTGGLCGLQTATKIIRRITSPPTAMPSIAAFEIGAAKKNQGRVIVIRNINRNGELYKL
jgi:hypothetical protein